ncbi:MAG: iron-containing alcohol dehydrogenase, partial [Rhodobacteraceae bacterium]|nr:iron-containing alcohol dehydrogenase [Paracoccaceae bacterium]
GFAPPYTIVSDSGTHGALGERIARSLARTGAVDEIILDHPHADMATARTLTQRLDPERSVVAVGSGTVNDLVKFATYRQRQRYCVFATAGSMNGYTSSTASMTLDDGLKVSRSAQLPAGFFVDLEVCASAPPWLNAAGFGDSLCRSTAQIDWWMSHRLLGTFYRHEPYLIEIPDELILMDQASGIARGNPDAVGFLFRVLTLCGLGISFTGVSNHGSMGEHQISHYIDCFAGDRHPGSTHGQQVGVATLTMGRIQQHILASEAPPTLSPVPVDHDDMTRRMGKDVAQRCAGALAQKPLDARRIEHVNDTLARIWPELRAECLEIAVPVEVMERRLREAGGPTTVEDLGVPLEFYHEAVSHAHEIRDRFSFCDLAAAMGVLPDLARMEC